MGSAELRSSAAARSNRRAVVSRRRRATLLAGLVALLLGGAYLIARETSVFAVDRFDVAGAPVDLERTIRNALAPFAGTSLVSLSASEVDRAIEAVPGVRSAVVERDFPHELRVVVRPERAVAVLRRDAEAWLVAASGRVLQPLEPRTLRPLPRVWIPSLSGTIEAGDVLLDDQGAAAVQVLAQTPVGFPARIDAARGSDNSVTLVLEGKTELRLGEAAQIRAKFDAAAAVLDALGETEARALAYLDVSVPTRPVSAVKSQVETSA